MRNYVVFLCPLWRAIPCIVGDWWWNFRRGWLATWSAITGDSFGLIVAMRNKVRRRFDGAFEDGIVSWRKRVSVITIRSAIEWWVQSANEYALSNTSAVPVRVTVQDGEVSFAETVTCVGRMLDDGRFVIAGVLFGCRIVLLEALAPLATCFAYVRLCTPMYDYASSTTVKLPSSTSTSSSLYIWVDVFSLFSRKKKKKNCYNGVPSR